MLVSPQTKHTRHCEEGAFPDEAIPNNIGNSTQSGRLLRADEHCPRNDILSFDARLAEQFSRSQFQFTGMPTDGISGDIITVIAEPHARVKRVCVRLFSFPDDLVIRPKAI